MLWGNAERRSSATPSLASDRKRISLPALRFTRPLNFPDWTPLRILFFGSRFASATDIICAVLPCATWHPSFFLIAL